MRTREQIIARRRKRKKERRRESLEAALEFIKTKPDGRTSHQRFDGYGYRNKGPAETYHRALTKRQRRVLGKLSRGKEAEKVMSARSPKKQRINYVGAIHETKPEAQVPLPKLTPDQMPLSRLKVNGTALNGRIASSLEESGINSIGDLAACSIEKLLAVPNIGKVTANKLRTALELAGITPQF
jgi:hypothetical protein